MSTPHNTAQNDEIAKIVLMPGDPLRAKFIAENYLDDPICFNTVRNVLGYTGAYKNKRISVMASGMGTKSCWSESTFAKVQSGEGSDVQYPSPSINQAIKDTAKIMNIDLKEYRLHSSDVFYHETNQAQDIAIKNGCAAVEMESFALFHNAHVLNKKAACICTVSDSFVHDENLTSKQRENSFDTMIKLALETTLRI